MTSIKDTNNRPIKALIVFRDNGETDNLFVPILCDAIRSAGIDVKCSLNEFWEADTTYDIIHFQWPEEVVGWSCVDASIIPRLEERIRFFRIQGARFVYTRHNERPHYANPVISDAYRIIETQSDIVVHMGYIGRDDFLRQYPQSQNAVIMHHIYECTYTEDITREEAREFLGLPPKKVIVLAFGKFRNSDERRMVLRGFRNWKFKNKLLLAPRFYPYSCTNKYGGNIFKKVASRIGYYILMPLLNWLRKMKAGANDELIDNCDLPYYLAASDAIIVQRRNTLNSGNIPLAFLFRKVVTGPNTGNISELLLCSGNPTFHPDESTSIAIALDACMKLSALGHGEENYRFAMENMNIEKIGKEYAEVYRKVIYGK